MSSLPPKHAGYVTIGHSVDTGNPVIIGDIERRSGLYILGRPGMGKTILLVNLVDRDIRNGHGLFYIDPHGDGISRLLNAKSYATQLAILDPEDEHYSFGINLFACKDISSRKERGDTYKRAYGAFERIWENEFAERPWLQLFIQNSIYAMIETPGCTLAELPLFLDPYNDGFRHFIVSNIRHNHRVAAFWTSEFKRSLRDQQERLDAALTRTNTLLAHEDVLHIVGQKETTLDFSAIMEQQRVLLLRLSANLSSDVKRFIGTILLSELLQAVRKRSLSNPRHFSIFVDEVQHFASSEDFSTLFTEARKFGIATSIAHQELFGQFADNKLIAGATDIAANKVLFQLGTEDAARLAPEFTKAPPKQLRREQALVISQYPCDSLLRGHRNPHIRAFVNRYLRPLSEHAEDVKAGIEGARILRMDSLEERMLALDEAALYRIDERLLPIDERARIFETILMRSELQERAIFSTSKAREYTARLYNFYQTGEMIRAQFRSYNHFFTALMEGRVRPQPGDEHFARFLISLIGNAYFLTRDDAAIMKLYVSLVYGDPGLPRTIGLAFATRHGILPDPVGTLTRAIEGEAEEKLAAYCALCEAHASARFNNTLALRRDLRLAKAECVRRQMTDSWQLHLLEHVYHTLPCFVFVDRYPAVLEVIKPFLSSRFAPPWSTILQPREEMLARARKLLADERRRTQCMRQDLLARRPPKKTLLQRLFQPTPPADGAHSTNLAPDNFDICFEESVLDRFDRFMAEHGEGALVALAIVQTAGALKSWRNDFPPHISPTVGEWRQEKSRVVSTLYTTLPNGSPGVHKFIVISEVCIPSNWLKTAHNIDLVDYELYTGFHMLYIPACYSIEPLQTLLAIDRINAILADADLEADCGAYYFSWSGAHPYSRQDTRDGLSSRQRDILKLGPFSRSAVINALEEKVGTFIGHEVNHRSYRSSGFDYEYKARDDLEFLRKAVDLHLQANELAKRCLNSPIVTRYCQLRACDIVRYGNEVADMTYPQPSLKNVTTSEVTKVVDWMTSFLKERNRAVEAQENEEISRRIKPPIEENINKMRELIAAQTKRTLNEADLPAVVLSPKEIMDVKNACLIQLGFGSNPDVDACLIVINDFVEFCRLLSMPENHIKELGGQWVEEEINARQFSDMTDESAWELLRLPQFRAYVKIIQEVAGEKRVWSGIVRTLPPPPSERGTKRNAEQEAIKLGHKRYCRLRGEIDDEIRSRQEQWLRPTVALPGPQKKRRDRQPPPVSY